MRLTKISNRRAEWKCECWCNLYYNKTEEYVYCYKWHKYDCEDWSNTIDKDIF